MNNIIQFRPAKELKFEDVNPDMTLSDIAEKAKELSDVIEVLTLVRHGNGDITTYTDLGEYDRDKLLEDALDYPEA